MNRRSILHLKVLAIVALSGACLRSHQGEESGAGSTTTEASSSGTTEEMTTTAGGVCGDGKLNTVDGDGCAARCKYAPGLDGRARS